jgi:hypothetical protein
MKELERLDKLLVEEDTPNRFHDHYQIPQENEV